MNCYTVFTNVATGTALAGGVTLVTHTLLESGKYSFYYNYAGQADAAGNSTFELSLIVGGVTVDSRNMNCLNGILMRTSNFYALGYLEAGTVVSTYIVRTAGANTVSLEESQGRARLVVIKVE